MKDFVLRDVYILSILIILFWMLLPVPLLNDVLGMQDVQHVRNVQFMVNTVMDV